MKDSKTRQRLLIVSLLTALFTTTGCETIESTFYEPVPYDEVAAEQGITLEEAEAFGIVRPRTSIKPLVEATTALIPAPGASSLASLVLNGALAVGAVWLGKKKRTADKVSASLVQGIDTFRDVLDQTPQGEKIDASLTATLKEHQQALQVQREITKLLERFATPTKKPIQLDT
jgi:hypothetical protein